MPGESGFSGNSSEGKGYDKSDSGKREREREIKWIKGMSF